MENVIWFFTTQHETGGVWLPLIVATIGFIVICWIDRIIFGPALEGRVVLRDNTWFPATLLSLWFGCFVWCLGHQIVAWFS